MNSCIKNLAEVVKLNQETSDTWTIFLKLISGNKDYKAGQFLNIDPKQFDQLSEIISFFEFKKNLKEQIRAYSISSIPSEETVNITVKKEVYNNSDPYPPILSPFLVSNRILGTKIEFSGYFGSYYIPEALNNNLSSAIHLVSGSGIVPSYSLIRDELSYNKNGKLVHYLINVNKTFKDIIFFNSLNKLQELNPEKLKIFYFITREENVSNYGSNFYKGRPCIEDIKKLIKDKDDTMFFLCGSALTKWEKIKAKSENIDLKPKFLESMNHILKELEIKNSMIRKEGW